MDVAFGGLLRSFRESRRFSQQKLALEAEVSTRHLSFLENGKARPSREMVLVLASVLEVPLRDRNAWLEAAGFASVYRETALDSPEMAAMRRAVELIVRQHDPFPSVVLDRRWDVLLVNEGYARLCRVALGVEVPPFTLLGEPRLNVMRSLFAPEGIRRFVVNFDEVARALVPRLVREAASGDEALRALVREVLAQPGVSAPRAAPPSSALLVPVVLRLGELELRMFSTIATLGTAQDVTLAELRIESYHPADDATDRRVRALAAS